MHPLLEKPARSSSERYPTNLCKLQISDNYLEIRLKRKQTIIVIKKNLTAVFFRLKSNQVNKNVTLHSRYLTLG